jgi:aminoglycoside 3-N-acetyltransferase I
VDIRIQRLTTRDRAMARRLFALMAETFGEARQPLSDGHVGKLLARKDFWALAAFAGRRLAGGLTAHVLPMTRAECAELFIYDVAIRPELQRMGIGRRLMGALHEQASAAGIREVFVLADNADREAVAFYRALGGAPSPVTLIGFSQEREDPT